MKKLKLKIFLAANFNFKGISISQLEQKFKVKHIKIENCEGCNRFYNALFGHFWAFVSFSFLSIYASCVWDSSLN